MLSRVFCLKPSQTNNNKSRKCDDNITSQHTQLDIVRPNPTDTAP